MKINVKFNNRWNAVPCGDGEEKISWLIDDLKKRFENNSSTLVCHTLLPNGEHCHLDINDRIKDVLRDQDFVYLGEKCKLFLPFSNSYLIVLL